MIPLWGITTFPKPTLALDFAGATSLDSRITFSRGSQATYFDSTGTLQFAPSNLIRNNTMQGAVAGTPGTLPTNWSTFTALTGLTRQIVGTGTESGITYVDIRISGTPSAAGIYGIYFEPATQVAALSGQTWTSSSYAKLAAGSLAGITEIRNTIAENNSGGSFLTQSNTPFTPTIAALNTQRVTVTRTLNQATTAFIISYWDVVLTGVAIDITLRIGMPQLQQGSVATDVNATSGTAYYAPRFDTNPSTLAPLGLLIEEQRTNSIRNNTMQGAVAGTPGTVPTNWALGGISGGLAVQVVGTGTENGITYVDIRIFGTNSSGSSVFPGVFFDTTTGISGTTGQVWAESVFLSLAAGTGINFDLGVHEYDSSNAFLRSTTVPGSTATPTVGSLTTRRRSGSVTLGSSTAFVRPLIAATVINGQSVDFTLRIGLPQLEQGAFATSVIPTTTTALTRNADVASMTGTNFSSWYNAFQGTLYTEGQIASGLGAAPAVYAGIDDTTLNNRMQSRRQSATVSDYRFVSSSGNFTGTATVGTLTGVNKQAIAYAVSDQAGAANATLMGSITPQATVPTVTRLVFGDGPGSSVLNGTIRRIAYYPVRLPDSTLQALTA